MKSSSKFKMEPSWFHIEQRCERLFDTFLRFLIKIIFNFMQNIAKAMNFMLSSSNVLQKEHILERSYSKFGEFIRVFAGFSCVCRRSRGVFIVLLGHQLDISGF